MSASIDQEETDASGGVREVLASWLESHAAGECDTPTMQAGFLDVCRRNHEAPWDALALLDQYQRRGKLEPDVARILKKEIAQMVFGTPTEATAHPREPARPQPERRNWPPADSAAEPPESDEEDEGEDEEDEEAEIGPSAERRPAAAASRPQNAPVQFPRRSEARSPSARSEPVRSLRGRYELLDSLGSGADGVVYRALDRNRQHLPAAQRYVAIKVLRSDPPFAPDALIEYQRRALQAQALLHPNMVRVLDFDHDGDVHFLVMELLQGQSLEALLTREAPRHDRALEIIRDIGAALTYAHEHGVILGNLTPRKVIVTAAGDAKLIDVGFPAASIAMGSRSEDPYAARYASVERITGEVLTTSDDVYSFACIAYELLGRRHPYGGRSGAEARLHQLRPEVLPLARPAWLALERGLRWTRAERDLTASQLTAALVSDETGPAPEPDLAIRAPRRDHERRSRSSAAAWLLAIFLVAGAGAAAWWLLPAPQQGEVRDRLEAIKDAVEENDDRAAPGEPLPPTSADTARSLENGQLIPAQPAGAATGPSALEALTEATQSQNASAEAPESPPESPAAAQQGVAPTPSAATSAAAGNGTIGFPKDTFVVRESDVVVRIPVVRTRGTRGEVSFRWRIEGNSAEPGADFGAVGPAREYMAAGQSSTVLHVPLVSDSEREGTEMFLVHIDEVGGGARLGELTRAAVIVVDDD